MAKENKIENEEIQEELEIELKDKKSERFFAHLHDIDTDYQVIVYQHGDKGKKIIVDRFENIVPDILTDIRDKHGAGTYSLYCHQVEDGKIVKMLDFCTVHLGGINNNPIISPSVNPSPQGYLKETLELIAGLKTIMGGGETNLNEFIKTQAEITRSQNQMMLEMSTKLMQAQLDGEKRFSAMIEKMTDKQGSIDNILKTVELIETLRGGGGGADKPIWERLIESPAAAPIIQSLLSPGQGQGTPQSQPSIPYGQTPKQLTSDEKVQAVFEQIPAETKKQIHSGNKDEVIQKLYDKNKNLLTLDETNALVNMILIHNQSQSE